MASMDSALDIIEADILPTITSMLGTMLDVASAATPGVDAAYYARQLHQLADQTDIVARQIIASTLPVAPPALHAARA